MFEFTKKHSDVSLYKGKVIEADFEPGMRFPVVGRDGVFVIISAGIYQFKIPQGKGKITKE